MHKILLYNTLSREKEVFSPIDKDEVHMYSCGPTVYNYPHIGNYRAYVFADILKRVLQYGGYKVKHVMNLTDIDDKTIRESQKEKKSLKEFTEFYTQEFLKDIKSLHIENPTKFTKATDYTPEMVEIIKKLLDKKLAYKSEDDSVYFDIKKFKNYGKLSHLVLENQKENAAGRMSRIKKDEYDKENAQDFALWKAWDSKDGDVFWETELGKGRPGWHIECSAMSMKNLGKQLDIHTGGVDNIFPHHENEIAQSEGATGKQFVKYWMHNEWVLVDQKKMAKSENNFYTLRDVIERDIDPVAYRFWLLMANYRTRVNFVWEALEGSEIRALTILWDVIKDEKISDADKKATVLDFDKVLGLGFADLKEKIIPEEVLKLVEEREQARKEKDFKKSDELRGKINSLGYEIKDTAEGQKISKI
ncbi:MAG: Cysteinyl tRNA-synthetase [Candidatus Nomurabacteria bacterium GW2011_GWA1_40_8]|nr:MAG: Cysteinyl tRNA-synthetase [Candidatus Nomurabacteria bacterium GW2011_GWA1_40_8]